MMLNYGLTCENIEDFIREKTNGFNGVVVGLSGGIDSAVSAALAVRALGQDKVMGLMLPCGDNLSENNMDAIELARHYLHIKYQVINILPYYSSFGYEVYGGYVSHQGPCGCADGNIKARLRMILLYANANHNNRLVLGTTNRSESRIGYYTKWGDGAVDIEPIVNLYKNEVRHLAKYLEIPEWMITKAPSAELWAGQTDEKEIGMTYDELDAVLVAIDTGKYPQGMLNSENYKRVLEKIAKSSHKREMPEGPKL